MEMVTPSGLVNQVFLRCVEDCFEPIMLTDRAGRLTYVNPAWILTYGYQKDEAIGQTPRILRSSFQDDEFYHSMWQTIRNPKIGFWRGEVVNRAKDGHLVPVLLTITPYRETTGEITGYMGIAVDLSDHKQLEQQILRQDRLASIGMLASGLAHEIGNPLGVIRGRAELVQHQVQNLPAAAQNVEIIINQIDRISGLIQSLLRAGRVPDQILLGEVRLETVVEEVLVLMADSCMRSGIELRRKNLDHKILAEPHHLQQVLLNVVINSLHAIEEQKDPEAQHFIEISAEARAAKCVVMIRDTGCGISNDKMDKLFQPFFTTKAAGQGTGLGLSIVAKLTEEMNGTVSVESPGPGQGATFQFEFNKA